MQQSDDEGAGCHLNRICKKSMTHDVDSHSACASVVVIDQNAIVATADLRYFCKIFQLLHAGCPFSTYHSSQMRSAYLELSGLCVGPTLSSAELSAQCILYAFISPRKFHAARLLNYLIWWVLVKCV